MTDELPPQIQAIADRLAETWGETIDVGPGWFDLIIRLDQELSRLSPGYDVEQCKSKYGTLRYYAHPNDPEDIDGQLAFNELILAAENQSATICEQCGNPGQQISLGGWIYTLCPQHTEQARQRALESLVSEDVQAELNGLPPARNCPDCGAPLEPGHIDDSITLVWLCPAHGVIERTEDPFFDTE